MKCDPNNNWPDSFVKCVFNDLFTVQTRLHEPPPAASTPCPRDDSGFLAQKWGSWVEATKLAFSVCRETGRPRTTAGRLVTWHWTHRRRRTMQYTQALVLTGGHVYYTWVRKAGSLGGRKAGRSCPRNARLRRQNGQLHYMWNSISNCTNAVCNNSPILNHSYSKLLKTELY